MKDDAHVKRNLSTFCSNLILYENINAIIVLNMTNIVYIYIEPLHHKHEFVNNFAAILTAGILI